MRQRVMIAMALACQPKLLIADEPTTALDATTEAQILDLLRSLQAEFRMAMMFITHDLGVIAEMAEQVIVMYLGRIVEQTYTQALLASIPQIGRKTGAPLRAIEGMVPSPFNIPKGCPFNPRCQQVMLGLCDVRYPALMKVGAGYAARCFLYGEETEGERDTAR
jgi:peptide/nickel transport system ATP-binding protein